MTAKGKTPLWRAIADAVQAEISDGVYGVGEKLPTEAALAERFGVNRHTVRHAVKALVEVGQVRTRRGAGVFVTARPTDYPLGARVRFHQNVLAGGQSPEKRVLSIEARASTPREAEILQLSPRALVCVYHGLSLADGQPVALFASHFPVERVPGIAEALAEERGVTDALRRCGVADYTRVSTRISARSASAVQALQLHVREGASLIYTTSVNVDAQGAPVEFGKTWFAGERVTLTLEG